jgi:hypothetical protein
MRYRSNQQIGHTITAPSTAVTAQRLTRHDRSSQAPAYERGGAGKQVVDDSGVRDGLAIRLGAADLEPVGNFGELNGPQ